MFDRADDSKLASFGVAEMTKTWLGVTVASLFGATAPAFADGCLF